VSDARPVLFSSAMIRAILAGAKTQTRRIVKPQPPHSCRYEINGAFSHALCLADDPSRPGGLAFVPPTATSRDHRLACPYGRPGDQLYVREKFRCVAWDEDANTTMEYAADGAQRYIDDDGPDDPLFWCDRQCSRWSRIKGARIEGEGESEQWVLDEGAQIPWQPGIHMPRWASRVTLEVTSVRVERVQAITGADALAEGVQTLYGPLLSERGAREAFERLWDQINGKRATWEANPFCWVVSFERVGGDHAAR